jgi:hypothetical protein
MPVLPKAHTYKNVKLKLESSRKGCRDLPFGFWIVVKGKVQFFPPEKFFNAKTSGFCKAQNNSLTFGSLKILLKKRSSQPLLFAKISKVIKNRTFPSGDVKGILECQTKV